MSTAGYLEKVYFRSDTTAPSSSDEVDGIMEFNFNLSVGTEETTDLADDAGFKTRIATLKDSSVDMSGDYEEADTIQDLLRTTFDNRTTGYLTVHMNPAASSGSKGWRIPVLIESYTASGAVGGVGKFSVKAVGNGAVVAV